MFKLYTNGKRKIRATRKAYELIYKSQNFEEVQEMGKSDRSEGDTSILEEEINSNAYDSTTIPELKEMLTSRGIEFNSKARKEDLIELLSRGDSND